MICLECGKKFYDTTSSTSVGQTCPTCKEKRGKAMKKKIIAKVSARELACLLEIGHVEDTEFIINALMKTLGRIKKQRYEWWNEIRKKYKISNDLKILTLDNISGEITNPEE